MSKKIFTILIITIFGLFFPTRIYAQDEFGRSMEVSFSLDEKGSTHANFDISIENLLTEKYLESFKLSLEGIKPENVKGAENKKNIVVNLSEENGKTDLETSFKENPLVGKGNQRNFSISFDDNSLVDKTGEVWEITLPKIDISSFKEVNLEFKVPKTFGQLAYISPDPLASLETEKYHVYYFDKDKLAKSGISAAFGQFQVFNFDLTYHLENPVNSETDIEIAIPAETSYQKVIYSSIDPKPKLVFIDQDGNWIAKYALAKRERFDVKVSGSVQVYAEPREFNPPSAEYINEIVKETNVWQVSDPEIQKLAQKYKTPKEIYDFVVSTLNYDYNKVQPNNQRMGAKNALDNPNSAICLEFTDLFIAIARASGIPAREINGYAYTENPELQPLSLVADVLHSWPEYWDKNKKKWIQVDPTWEKTTGGVDFFSKLDLRHITFVTHGINSDKPYAPGSYKLGANPQKDVYVAFGKLPENRNSNPVLSIKKVTKFPITNLKYTLEVENPGPVALYDKTLDIYYDDKKISEKTIDQLPPYGIDTNTISVSVGFLGNKIPRKIVVKMDGKEISYTTNKESVFLVGVTFILVTLLILIILIFRYLHKKK